MCENVLRVSRECVHLEDKLVQNLGTETDELLLDSYCVAFEWKRIRGKKRVLYAAETDQGDRVQYIGYLGYPSWNGIA